jgi:hypothetical protein
MPIRYQENSESPMGVALYIRAFDGDEGVRPFDPPDTIGYLSPDIWIESSDPYGSAVTGEDNYIHVRIHNGGEVPAGQVWVYFYSVDASVGLSPNGLLLIGYESGIWVDQDNHYVDVRCNTPWRPASTNGGEQRLIVNCEDKLLDPFPDPQNPPWCPYISEHVGMRAITVLQGNPGSKLTFKSPVHNWFPMAAKTTIGLRVEHVATPPGRAHSDFNRELLNSILACNTIHTHAGPALDPRAAALHAERPRVSSERHVLAPLVQPVARPPGTLGSTPHVRATLADGSILAAPTVPGRALADILLVMDQLGWPAIAPHQIMLAETTLQPFEERALCLELEIPGDAKPGEFIVFHLYQISTGMPLGGHAVVVRVGEQDRSTAT